jgi:hypothetical protein
MAHGSRESVADRTPVNNEHPLDAPDRKSTGFRKPLLYPLSYEGGGCRKAGRKRHPRPQHQCTEGQEGPEVRLMVWPGGPGSVRPRSHRRRAIGESECRLGGCWERPRPAEGVIVERQGVHHQGVAQQVQVLPGVPQAVSPP